MKPLHSSLSYLSISLLFLLLLHFGDFLTWVEASNNGHISVHIESKNASVLHHGNKNNKNENGSSTNGHNSTTPKKSQVDEDDDDYDYKELDDDYKEEDYLIHPSKERKEWTSISCPKPLEGRCHCGHQRDPRDHDRIRTVVNCTHSGFTETDFFIHIPEETEYLIVRGNHLPSLPVNIFGPTKFMERLRELDLADNGIQYIKGKTFHHVPNVETLILNYNKLRGDILMDHPRLFSNFYSLRYLHLTGAFDPTTTSQWDLENGLRLSFVESNMTKLEKLHLEQNHISRIPNAKEFCDLRSLMDLHLGQNELTDVPFDLDSGECLPLLRYVDLSHNKIKTITQNSGVFQLMNHRNQRGEPVQVELLNNPFQCDCSLNFFLSWIKNITLRDPDVIRHRNEMRCRSGYPESNKGLIVFYVNHTECGPQPETTNAVINRLSTTILSTMLMSGVAVIMILYVRSRGVPEWLRGICSPIRSPLLLTTTTGVKYTSVDKEEVAEVAHV